MISAAGAAGASQAVRAPATRWKSGHIVITE